MSCEWGRVDSQLIAAANRIATMRCEWGRGDSQLIAAANRIADAL